MRGNLLFLQILKKIRYCIISSSHRTVPNPRLALVGLIIPPASVCVLMRWLFSCDHARRYNTLCGGHFELTLTAVALLLHSMENSIVLMGLRAVFSDWLHPIITTNQITVYLKHVGLF